MAFEPKNITKDHILQGVAKIQEEQPELKPSKRWDVVINGKHYLLKEVMRYANQEMNGEKFGNMVVAKQPIHDVVDNWCQLQEIL